MDHARDSEDEKSKVLSVLEDKQCHSNNTNALDDQKGNVQENMGPHRAFNPFLPTVNVQDEKKAARIKANIPITALSFPPPLSHSPKSTT